MDTLLVLLFVLLFIIVVYILIFIRIYTNPMKRTIPGLPVTSPIFGTYGEFLKSDCRLLEFIKEDKVKYGPIRTSYVFLGGMRLNVAQPYWIRYILSLNSKNYKRGDFPGAENLFVAVGKNGLVLVNGDVHKKLRKLATPAFKLSSLKKVMPIIEMCGQRMINLFSLRCKESGNNEAEIGVKEILNKTTLDVIGLIAFGHDFGEACSFDTGTFGCNLRIWLDEGMIPSLFAIFPFQVPSKIFALKLVKYLPKYIRENYLLLSDVTIKIHDLVEHIVRSKIENKRNETEDDSNKSKTLLDFILDGSDSVDINSNEIHDLLMTFLIAGHETSSLAITWTLYLLAQHPKYQQRCRQEIKTFFEEHQNTIQWDDVKFPFLNAVVHESLRLYPPVPWLQRYTINDDEIAGYRVPSNTDILLIICEMHRNPEYWPDPEKFYPERFLEPPETIPWDAFMPFGDGVHKCIGYQLALTEILYFMAILLKNFDFSIDDSVTYTEFVVVTMQPKPPLKLIVKKIL